MSKVWFITGTSKGFGRIWAEAALERGDRVVATARNASTLTDLVERYGDNVLALKLDVTDKPAVEAAIARAHEHFGRLDVVAHNVPISCAGVLVYPGDLVLADHDGVVVVPIKLAPELLAHASEHAEWEEFSRMRLSQGGDLRKYYPLREDARAEYEAWRKEQGS